jgi:tetratricopeptide (TPR) repeat protein
MKSPRSTIAAVFLAVAVPALAAQPAKPPTPDARSGAGAAMRLSTTYDHARQMFGRAIVLSGNYRLDECLKSLRVATAEDPAFAAAWALLAYYATDSHEAAEALARAQALAGRISPSEMLLVHWVAAREKNDQLSAIASLNDLTGREGGDKYILYLAGKWFVDQHHAERAIPLFEKVLEIDPEFTPVLNRLGYSYAASGDLARAEALMKRYVAAMPGDPNPEDSYGDILFKAGLYQQAKAHFVAALRKDPAFAPSQHELGDVYAMLGDQQGARDAYEKSARVAENARRNLEYRSSIALSYVRENLYALADNQYQTLAAEAKAKRFTDLEAGFLEAMAMYQSDDRTALRHLDQAEAAIRDNSELAMVTRDEHMAVVRRWRGIRSLHAGNPTMSEVCLRVLEQRYQMTDNESIGTQMHALNGAILLERQKLLPAIAELEQSGDDAYSLGLLARAKREAGDGAGADAAMRQLLKIHASTMDAVLVVEPAREKFSVSAQSR